MVYYWSPLCILSPLRWSSRFWSRFFVNYLSCLNPRLTTSSYYYLARTSIIVLSFMIASLCSDHLGSDIIVTVGTRCSECVNCLGIVDLGSTALSSLLLHLLRSLASFLGARRHRLFACQRLSFLLLPLHFLVSLFRPLAPLFCYRNLVLLGLLVARSYAIVSKPAHATQTDGHNVHGDRCFDAVVLHPRPYVENDEGSEHEAD